MFNTIIKQDPQIARINTLQYIRIRIRITLFWKYIYDMAMKIKFIIYAPGNRNYGYYRLHFSYQIMIYNITDRNLEINVD